MLHACGGLFLPACPDSHKQSARDTVEGGWKGGAFNEAMSMDASIDAELLQLRARQLATKDDLGGAQTGSAATTMTSDGVRFLGDLIASESSPQPGPGRVDGGV